MSPDDASRAARGRAEAAIDLREYASLAGPRLWPGMNDDFSWSGVRAAASLLLIKVAEVRAERRRRVLARLDPQLAEIHRKLDADLRAGKL